MTALMGFACAPPQKAVAPALQDGDIVFQCTNGPQCEAIAQATRSPYTHCGIVFLQDGKPFVWEAVGPVRKVPYPEWVRHGVKGHVVVKRLRDTALLDQARVEAMKAEGEREMGRPYDIYFDMDDERIYCSELVQKVYERGAGLHIGAVERFRDMDLTGEAARHILDARFGTAIPADREVVTPAALFRSPLLLTVDSVGSPTFR
ncbi:MAG TPA: YiiX/YebB-like N1pC/P60 family cysteine hydrolase [Flavobacteriales bacterium]|jgi:hypothetical protein|nr:YiiX/YebB-like N1pC/P60 family cysteine hydrolase [Flavobacteriales bacterium]